MTERLSILERIAAATGDVGVLQKDAKNDHDNYSYLSEAAVKRAASEVVSKHRIAPESITYEILSDEWIEQRNGGAMNYVKLRCTLEFAGKPSEGLGCGRDYGDKAIYKAQTGALREAWKGRLGIATGGDPEKPDDTSGVQHDTPQGARGARRGGSARAWVPKWPSFGDDAGKTISDASDETLRGVVDAMSKDRALSDPKWGDKNRKTLDAALAELESRSGGDSVTSGLRDHVDAQQDANPDWGMGDYPPPIED